VYLARVVGDVVSTHKNDRLDGKKLLLVQRLDLAGEDDGSVEVIALDVVDAGIGDKVLVVQEGSSARKIFDDEKIPVQAVIVGILESVSIEGGRGGKRREETGRGGKRREETGRDGKGDR
jgi:ethanolamine utilization protein EutN